jgi:hypothetical protein
MGLAPWYWKYPTKRKQTEKLGIQGGSGSETEAIGNGTVRTYLLMYDLKM